MRAEAPPIRREWEYTLLGFKAKMDCHFFQRRNKYGWFSVRLRSPIYDKDLSHVGWAASAYIHMAVVRQNVWLGLVRSSLDLPYQSIDGDLYAPDHYWQ